MDDDVASFFPFESAKSSWAEINTAFPLPFLPFLPPPLKVVSTLHYSLHPIHAKLFNDLLQDRDDHLETGKEEGEESWRIAGS